MRTSPYVAVPLLIVPTCAHMKIVTLKQSIISFPALASCCAGNPARFRIVSISAGMQQTVNVTKQMLPSLQGLN